MCEILVRAVDGQCEKVEANPLRGMPVVVMPDDHAWGNAEGWPEYVVVKLPGVSADIVKQYVAPWITVSADVIPVLTTHGRRRYLVPEVIVAAAEKNGGTYTRTINQLTRSLIDRAA